MAPNEADTCRVYVTPKLREVVQVKRHSKASIPRQTIDQLRGSLPYH